MGTAWLPAWPWKVEIPRGRHLSPLLHGCSMPSPWAIRQLQDGTRGAVGMPPAPHSPTLRASEMMGSSSWGRHRPSRKGSTNLRVSQFILTFALLAPVKRRQLNTFTSVYGRALQTHACTPRAAPSLLQGAAHRGHSEPHQGQHWLPCGF